MLAQALPLASLLLGPAEPGPEAPIPVQTTDSVALELEPPPAPPKPPAPEPAPPEPASREAAPVADRLAEGPALADGVDAAIAPRRERMGCKGSASCVRLSATGIAFGSVAVASIVAGVVLYARPDEVLADDPAYVRSTRPPGVVLMTIGTGVAMSSALMMVAAYRGSRAHRGGRLAALRLGRQGVEVVF